MTVHCCIFSTHTHLHAHTHQYHSILRPFSTYTFYRLYAIPGAKQQYHSLEGSQVTQKNKIRLKICITCLCVSDEHCGLQGCSGCTGSRSGSGQISGEFGGYGSDPDPAGSNVSGSSLDPDPSGSEVGSGKYWPDLHNYDIKHHNIFSFQEMTHDNTELHYKTSLTHISVQCS